MSQLEFVLLISIIGISIAKGLSQEITMFPSIWGNEYYEDEMKISNKQVKKQMQNHELTKMYWTKSRKDKRFAGIAFGAQVLTSILVLGSVSNSNGSLSDRNKLLLTTSLASGAFAIGFSISSASLNKKAILSYNKLHSLEGLLVQIGQTRNGIGIVCSF